MKGELIDLDSKRPHTSGPVVCLECKHKWTGVIPVGTTSVQCPNCGTAKGTREGFVCPPDFTFYECPCGNYHFFIGVDGAICCCCGKSASF